jgi:Tol biopolymer transport system component
VFLDWLAGRRRQQFAAVYNPRRGKGGQALRILTVLLVLIAVLSVAACTEGEQVSTPTAAPGSATPATSPVVSVTASPARTVFPATPVGTAEAIPFGKVSFSSRRDGYGEIYLLTPEGERNVSNSPTEDQESSLSPDGKKIAFASDRDGTSHIYVVNVDGSGLVKLTNDAAGDLSPKWSPDGKQIAFSRTGSLYIMDSDGGNVRQLTEAGPETSAPPCKSGSFLGSWSPDGKRLVFYAASATRELGQICIIGSDGSGLTVVASEPPAYHVEPSWSPDGEWIVYRFIDKGPSSGPEDDNHEIYLVKPDGTSRTNLTNNRATDIEPSWSPDGQWIIFSSDRTGGFDLYIMRPDGSDLKRITTDPFKDSDPSWGP